MELYKEELARYQHLDLGKLISKALGDDMAQVNGFLWISTNILQIAFASQARDLWLRNTIFGAIINKATVKVITYFESIKQKN